MHGENTIRTKVEGRISSQSVKRVAMFSVDIDLLRDTIVSRADTPQEAPEILGELVQYEIDNQYLQFSQYTSIQGVA